MKALQVHRQEPTSKHRRQAKEFGDESLGNDPPEDFFKGAPQVAGMVRAEPGCLINMSDSVKHHSDDWLGRGNPKFQRSLFWIVDGEVEFKVDGHEHVRMVSGDYVVFDHRKEHCVIANEKWLGAAWQMRKAAR